MAIFVYNHNIIIIAIIRDIITIVITNVHLHNRETAIWWCAKISLTSIKVGWCKISTVLCLCIHTITSCSAICDESDYRFGCSFFDGKGQPGQISAVSHGCSTARFNDVNVINTERSVG